ncbi:ribonuclease HII [Sporosarcina sp. NCCP-2222]|uniref:ribonuclease HII n=1 Tax=Sporosarcina sp. NCCP-2222 TaxID=2935073 RepID=UPI00207F0B77|nr:ribonuclease HII [Sporosarcina sp. NCCP-2222]GKV55609.1 ribonuclease HII [Sporosarcina sp. NCCP-2222]
MRTVKEIAERLQNTEVPESWMDELAEDSRAGVKNELKRWQRRYEKRLIKEAAYMEKVEFDKSYKRFEGAMLAGIDEAGRGPLAGPVVCAAVILPKETEVLIGLDDSKKIPKHERIRLAELIKKIAISYSIHIQTAERIDELNIYSATKASMETAIAELQVRPDVVLADAMPLNTGCEAVSVIKGDAKSLAIAAASILAKTTRDDLMEQFHEKYPMYNFKQNAGYGTEEHVEALYAYGPCEIHRKTFEPVKTVMERGLFADEPSDDQSSHRRILHTK